MKSMHPKQQMPRLKTKSPFSGRPEYGQLTKSPSVKAIKAEDEVPDFISYLLGTATICFLIIGIGFLFHLGWSII